MKKHISIISAAILLGSLLLLSGCNKNEFGQAGKLVQFGARSEGVSTRTEYGGKDNDASGIEPIWWKSGDQVRIVSDKAVVTGTTNNYSDYQFADFVDGNKSRATISNVGANGLAWVDGESTYDFYAVYPANGMEIGTQTGNLGSVKGEIFTPQEVIAHEYSAADDKTAKDWYHVTNGKYTVYEPDMKYATMTAKTAGVKSADKAVELTFYPAFTAFEFTFESADPAVDIDLTEFRMESASTALAGVFTGNAGDRSFVPAQTASTTLSLSNPSALGTIKNGEPKSFTIFAMPQDLKDLTIYFADKDDDGAVRSRMLPLVDKTGASLTFTAGHKYRIKGLKLPGGKYQFYLTLNGIAQQWDAQNLETLFSDQIQCSALTFDKSAREMTDEYINSPITTSHTSKSNNYKFNAPIGDGRWQVRTLNNIQLDNEEKHDYFTVTFTPTAPLGGYWRLDTHDNPYWTVKLVNNPGEVSQEVVDLPSEGRIMNQKVTLWVIPNVTLINAAPASTEIGLYFDCYFSTNIDFDPVLDANTEFQDIHGAGTYSYWLLTYERQ